MGMVRFLPGGRGRTTAAARLLRLLAEWMRHAAYHPERHYMRGGMRREGGQAADPRRG